MEPRLKYGQVAPEGIAKMTALEHYLNAEAGLDPTLMEMVRLRTSLMNGCEYCIGVHTAELKKHNETPTGLLVWPNGGARARTRIASARRWPGPKP